jgi:hypothetical protein
MGLGSALGILDIQCAYNASDEGRITLDLTRGSLKVREESGGTGNIIECERADGTSVFALAYDDATGRVTLGSVLGLDIVGDGAVRIGDGSATIGAFGATPIVRPTVTGSRGGNAALASLLTALANLGWIIDSTTA